MAGNIRRRKNPLHNIIHKKSAKKLEEVESESKRHETREVQFSFICCKLVNRIHLPASYGGETK